MTIAMPLFGKRVSPHFSTAPELFVALAEDRRISSCMRFDFGTISLAAKRQKILTLGVDTLVCGGIDRTTHGWLQKRGIKVVANVQGEAEEVLASLLGELQTKGVGGNPP